MLKAFVSLGETLSLTKTCEQIGATRQTVRRHISDLEEIIGHKLFSIVERQYQLTPSGISHMDGAAKILRSVDIWSGVADLKSTVADGLELEEYTDADGRKFFSQQHPVSSIAINGLPLMKKSLEAWGTASGAIEHPAMAPIRPYLVLMRRGPSGWVFVDIGPESAYANWFGWKWSKSAIGMLVNDDSMGEDYTDFVSKAYNRVSTEGSVRLDHIYAHLLNAKSEQVPVTFQRLLLGCTFPDGTPGLILVAAGTSNVEIHGLKESELPEIPSDQIMDGVLDDNN